MNMRRDGAWLNTIVSIAFLWFAQAGFAQSVNRTTASTQNAVSGLSVNNIRGTSNGQKALPKLEMGFGMISTYLNDYPGSNQQHYFWLPLPYLVYRGDFLRSDRHGALRGILLDSTEVDIDASVAGSFPVNGSEDQARQGMPNLDWMAEVGPRVLIHLIHKPKLTLDFSVPIRWVFSTDLSRLDDRGFDCNPELTLSRRSWFDPHGTFIGYFGALWGTSQLTRYFYQVSPQYASANRPAYSALPGYMYDYVGLNYRHSPSSTSKMLYFGGFDESFYAGAANRNSPLMRTIQNQSVFVGIIYDFYRSKERASRQAVIE